MTGECHNLAVSILLQTELRVEIVFRDGKFHVVSGLPIYCRLTPVKTPAEAERLWPQELKRGGLLKEGSLFS